MRADQLLVSRGLAASRTLARRLIEAGRVHADSAPVSKPAESLNENADIVITPGDDDRYVSRGGLKLAGAIAHVGLDVRNLTCLDVGQSTGGFTDCLLQAGARHVVGIDVGHDQLSPLIRADKRVTAIEGVNARAIGRDSIGEALPDNGFDLIVVDVSFISLTLVLAALAPLIAADGHLLALVKPQFEVGKAGLDGRGIVRSPDAYPQVRDRITGCANTCGLTVLDWFDSPIKGGDGNREFFIHARRATDDAPASQRTLS